jgi:integrin-linked kinase-associated serine/threonine phosphatase 2C
MVGEKRTLTEAEESRAAKVAKDATDCVAAPSTYKYALSSGAFGNKGLKPALEDVEQQIADLCEHSGQASLAGVRSAFYAVYDGHAGKNAAEFCFENMAKIIAAKVSNPLDNENVRAAIKEGFKETDQKFLEVAAEKGWKDGCTAVTLTIINDVCFLGWVGDSKAILVRRESDDQDSLLKILELTHDHKCMVVKERDRIVKAGGFVQDNRVNGIMEVSRSIGDAALKKAGVSSTPDLQRVTLCDRDEFILLACDGLWAVFDVKEACTKAYKSLKAGVEAQEVAFKLVLLACFTCCWHTLLAFDMLYTPGGIESSP